MQNSFTVDFVSYDLCLLDVEAFGVIMQTERENWSRPIRVHFQMCIIWGPCAYAYLFLGRLHTGELVHTVASLLKGLNRASLDFPCFQSF